MRAWYIGHDAGTPVAARALRDFGSDAKRQSHWGDPGGHRNRRRARHRR